jgi:signal transduction histidine kinase
MNPEPEKPVDILIVEDELVNSRLLQGLLKKSTLSIRQMRAVDSLQGAFAALAESPVDAVLLDLNVTDSQGLDTLIHLGGKFPDVAIIVITGEYGEEIGLQTLAAGAQEYLVKGKYDLYTLTRSIRYAIERKRAECSQHKLLKELESVNKELTDFAYMVSHDLKAPLRGIHTLAEWISEDCADKLGPEGKEHLELLGQRVTRMHCLIEGVLQYSRLGRVREEPVEVDLNHTMREVIEMIAPPPSIRVRIENELPTLMAEPTRILQVFQNLISNAVKYMDKPQGDIRLHCEARGDVWKFCVEDNGPGIEAKDFERIFQMFQTAGDRKHAESTGIGLTIVKKIVEMYGGRIWVESTVGQGSRFNFELPCRPAMCPAVAGVEVES